jgi:hypothetical protein
MSNTASQVLSPHYLICRSVNVGSALVVGRRVTSNVKNTTDAPGQSAKNCTDAGRAEGKIRHGFEFLQLNMHHC